jgi:FkbM family methyltransferase
MLVQGSKMQWSSKFSYVTDEIIKTGKYEVGLDFIKSLTKSSFISADIGANIGYYTLMLAQTSKHVYAYEPEIENFDYLKKNIYSNNYQNVTPQRLIIGDKDRQERLYLSKICTGMHRIYQSKYANNGTQDCLMRQLDNLIDHVDFIKIDVEGSEYSVLKGMPRLLETAQIILLEHDWEDNELQIDSNKTLNLLSNFTVYKHMGTPNLIAINNK